MDMTEDRQDMTALVGKHWIHFEIEYQEHTCGCASMAMIVRAKRAMNSILMKILYCGEKTQKTIT